MINIDKHILYSHGSYTFKNFVDLSKEDVEMVLDWRNDSSIRQFMYNRDIISLPDHVEYVNSLNNRCDRFYWMVLRDNESIGVVDITDVDAQNAKAELGYYMSPQKKNSGIGLDFVCSLLYFLFERGIASLFGNVDANNKSALVLDEYLGCEFSYDKQYEDNGATYIPWVLKKEKFMLNANEKNNLRSYYMFIKQYHAN